MHTTTENAWKKYKLRYEEFSKSEETLSWVINRYQEKIKALSPDQKAALITRLESLGQKYQKMGFNKDKKSDLSSPEELISFEQLSMLSSLDDLRTFDKLSIISTVNDQNENSFVFLTSHVLGYGSFAIVKLGFIALKNIGEWHLYLQPVAVKIIYRENGAHLVFPPEENNSKERLLYNQIFSHKIKAFDIEAPPHALLNSKKHDKKEYIVMPLFRENIQQFLCKKDLISNFNDMDIALILYKISQAVLQLHLQDISHNDLKCNNIFFIKNNKDSFKTIFDSCEATTIDFDRVSGDAREKNNYFWAGGFSYFAPEIFESNYKFNYLKEESNVSLLKADIFSLGLVFLKIILAKNPGLSKEYSIQQYETERKDTMGFYQNALYNSYHDSIRDFLRVNKPFLFLAHLDLFFNMLKACPSERPSIQDIFQKLKETYTYYEKRGESHSTAFIEFQNNSPTPSAEQRYHNLSQQNQ
jgi:serine/threonine protein kinase